MQQTNQQAVPGQQRGDASPGLLYAAFEGYPGHKGAHTHIRHILRGAAQLFPDRTLVTLGQGGEGPDPLTGATHLPVAVTEANLLRRSELFGRELLRIADRLLPSPPAVIQFRDIWSGIPLLSHPIARTAAIIFEVNGLPSVELSAHYPRLAANGVLIARLRRMEELCLARASRLIAVSDTGARYLRERGARAGKIHVIPNAALLPDPREQAPVAASESDSRDEVIVYVGTLAPWQGIDSLLQALVHLQHRPRLRLLLVTPGKKWLRQTRANADRLGVGDRIEVRVAQSHEAVRGLVAGAVLAVAPLSRGARNELQGCSPLKIVESMAWGAPVVATDLPVVRELVRHGEDGWLVPPGSPRALAGGIERLLADPALRDRLATEACRTARERYSLSLFTGKMERLYRDAMEEG
jgi:glycosyltransferase involved in cell wall biosynthesis